MANRFVKSCISEDVIGEKLYYINGSLDFYITKSIDIYKHYIGKGYYKMAQHINGKNGYVYCAVRYKDDYKFSTERVHRIVALTFIHNDDTERKLMVGHKNNIKHDNRIENLYWTTNQENTKKASDDGLNPQLTGIDNENSKPVLVTDLDKNIVAVYGGMRECCRMVENLSIGYLNKTIRDFNDDYKPRNKRYKYFNLSKEEYDDFEDVYKNLKLKECTVMKKQFRLFKATNLLTGEEIISDNQKQFAKDHHINQANISQALIKNRPYENWIFEAIKDLEYTETSAYNNMIDLFDNITIKHIETDEEMFFTNPKKLKDHFGMVGHDVNQYITRGILIFSKWKIIKINNQYILN